MIIRRLEWDSDFFGYETGEIVFQEKEHLENYNNYKLIYIKSSQDFEKEINYFKCEFSETKVVFEKELEFFPSEKKHIYSNNEIDFDINQLYELAFESGKYSRFKLDEKFTIKKFKELYQKWVDNSISRSFADDVLIYSENNQIMGFVTYKISENFGTIGLIAVSPNFQGKGIGKKLLTFIENVLFSKGIKTLIIPTQLINETAYNFYKNQNYKIKETSFIKHYWRI